MVDPEIVLEKIVVNPDNGHPSYFGTPVKRHDWEPFGQRPKDILSLSGCCPNRISINPWCLVCLKFQRIKDGRMSGADWQAKTRTCYCGSNPLLGTSKPLFFHFLGDMLCRLIYFAYLCNAKQKGAIAQLVEQRTENPCVPGSIPGGTTLKKSKRR